MPVGLWQQACNNTMSPAGIFLSAAIIASKSSPRPLLSIYAYVSTCWPAAEKMAAWFAHVGLLSQTLAAGKCFLRKSAATRNDPVPPGVCAVMARRQEIASCPGPNTNSWARAS
jgi:hypothetical protein